MILTKNFHLDEFKVSREHPELAAQIVFTPTETERIRFACASILQPLRDRFNLAVHITSGKRTRQINTLVGGHPGSHHMFEDDHGATDFVIAAFHDDVIAYLRKSTRFRYLIYYRERKFFHLSYPDSSGIYNEIMFKE